MQEKVAPLTAGAGIEEVLAQGSVAVPDGTPQPIAVRFSYRPGSGVVTSVEAPPTETLKPIDDAGFSKLIEDRDYPQRFSTW